MSLRTFTRFLLAQHRRATFVLFGLTLAAWTVALFLNASPVAGGADSSGYMNNARLLLQGRLQGDLRPIPEVPENAVPLNGFAPLGFRADPDSLNLVPTYPIGFPLLLAPFQAVFASRGGTLAVLVLLGLAAPLLTWKLARRTGLPAEWAAFCAICLTTSAVFQMHAYLPMTDVETLVVATSALIVLLRFDRSPWNGVFLGALLAFGVLSRPANILLFLPVVVYLLQNPRRLIQSWTIVLGGLPGAVFQIWINLRLYDRALTTGYGDFRAFFELERIPPALGFFFHQGLTLITPMALFGFLASPFVIRRNLPILLAPAVLVLSYLLFYSSYYFASEYWWSLRFILPVFPAVIILGSHVWSQLQEQGQRLLSSPAAKGPDTLHPGPLALKWVPFGLSIIAILIGHQTSRNLFVHQFHLEEAQYADSAAWLAEHTDPGDVILCMQTSGSVFNELPNPILRWDMMDPERWQAEIAPALTRERRVFATLFPFERDENAVLVKRVPGNWIHRADFGRVSIFELQP
ncbi:MAG: glycosyltransferase family 39 protein [Opitutaceae bacterium]